MSPRLHPLATAFAVCACFDAPPPPAAPPGFSVAIEARGLEDARNLRAADAERLVADSQDPASGYEIQPSGPREPTAVMRVAVALAETATTTNYTSAAAFPLRWNAAAAQLTFDETYGDVATPEKDAVLSSDVVARWFEGSNRSAVAMSDGRVFVLDSPAGIVYRFTPRLQDL